MYFIMRVTPTVGDCLSTGFTVIALDDFFYDKLDRIDRLYALTMATAKAEKLELYDVIVVCPLGLSVYEPFQEGIDIDFDSNLCFRVESIPENLQVLTESGDDVDFYGEKIARDNYGYRIFWPLEDFDGDMETDSFTRADIENAPITTIRS